MHTTRPTPTGPETDLAHRLALGWALAGVPPATVAPRWLGVLATARRAGYPRVRVVLDEAARVYPAYRQATPDDLALHVATYALGSEYGTPPEPHGGDCLAHGGGRCSCAAEAVAGGAR